MEVAMLCEMRKMKRPLKLPANRQRTQRVQQNLGNEACMHRGELMNLRESVWQELPKDHEDHFVEKVQLIESL